MKSLKNLKNILVRKVTPIGIGVIGSTSTAMGAVINWTEGKENVEGAMDLFIAFVAKVPEIIMYLFIIIVLMGIAYAIRNFADRIGKIIKI